MMIQTWPLKEPLNSEVCRGSPDSGGCPDPWHEGLRPRGVEAAPTTRLEHLMTRLDTPNTAHSQQKASRSSKII